MNQGVFDNIINGKQAVDIEISQIEKRKNVFAFISNETKQSIALNMKQALGQMDDIERRHYEQKVSKLDGLIARASEEGEHVTMD